MPAVVKLITQEVGMDRLEYTNNTHSKVRVTEIIHSQMIILASFTAVHHNMMLNQIILDRIYKTFLL